MAATPPRDTATAAAGLTGSPDGWGWTLACGILLVVAGVLALGAPLATTLALTGILGWVLVIAGIGGIVMGLRTRIAHRRTIDLLYGGVSLIVGIILLDNLLAGALSLTLAFAFFLAFRGAVELGGGSRSHGHARTALIVAGAVNLMLAFLLVMSWPASVQVIGMFVGISFLIGGIVTIIAATQLRRLAHPGA